MNIGLTGGIATGKSTVSKMLVDKGAILIDADQVAREVVLPGSAVLDKVYERFGQAIRNADGSLDRKKLGDIVFADRKARKDLEALLHPAIREIMKERMSRAELEHPESLVVADIPLLFESGLQHLYDEVLLVYVPEEIQIRRLMARDGIDEEQATLRIRAQMPIEDKKKMADIVIDNSGTPESTRNQIDLFWIGKGLK
ncbi:dephospho-CoA kinase [Ferviditalea candida]|uniref:Dephospho-CoA kinase n=1 Tax=Ferviditalea candida TaxID=3108399 RepID=A0ABU5ZDE2_9BACL|nr:dephospho-CoA kinase [Paenibacillaceae bacterium T2]